MKNFLCLKFPSTLVNLGNIVNACEPAYEANLKVAIKTNAVNYSVFNWHFTERGGTERKIRF